MRNFAAVRQGVCCGGFPGTESQNRAVMTRVIKSEEVTTVGVSPGGRL